MLPAAETSLIRRNPDIPGLRKLLDPDLMLGLLRARATVPVAELSLRPRYIRLKPTSSCLVAYECVADGQRVPLYAKANSAGNAAKLNKAAQRPAIDSPLGPGRIVDRADLLAVSFFPNDMALRSLKRYLADTPDVKMLAYKPERRFVGLLTHPDRSHTTVKVYKASAFASAERLARIASGIPWMPHLRAVDAKRHALHLDWIAGTTLTERMRDNVDVLGTVRAAGAALAQLHALSPAPGLRQRTLLDEHTTIGELTRGICALCPEIEADATAHARQIGALLDARLSEPTLIHGDFYANQIVATDQGIRLLDFDELSVGSPETDLGLFIAHLEYDVLRGRLTAGQVDPLAAALLGGYRTVRKIDPRVVFAHTLFGMLQLSHRPFRDVLGHWPLRTHRWFARIDHLLQRPPEWSQLDTHPAGPTAAPAAPDPLMPQLVTALDLDSGVRMVEQALAGLGPTDFAPMLDQARLIRHKPGRRALIEYRFVFPNGGEHLRAIGKIRAKRSDHRTYRLNQAIYSATQDEKSGCRLRVPRPLAEVPALNMWLQQRIDGEDGWSALASPRGEQAARCIAHALFELHQLELEEEKTHDWTDELTILDQRLDRLQAAAPLLTRRIQALRRSCHRVAAPLDNRHLCNIHRDFYPDQVIVQGQQVYLLDLDLYCRGDPAVDLGNFIAHLQEADLRRFHEPKKSAHLADTFLSTYCELSGDADLPWAVEIYRLLTLVRLGEISTRMVERRAYTMRIMEFCEHEFSQFPAQQISHNKQVKR